MGMFSDLHKQDIAEQQSQVAPVRPKQAQRTQVVDTSTAVAELTAPHDTGRAESASFTQPSVQLPDTRPAARPAASSPARTTEDASATPADRRVITRKSFELFQDQFDTLKRLSLEDQLQGGKGSMSEMVREALDRFIAESPFG